MQSFFHFIAVFCFVCRIRRIFHHGTWMGASGRKLILEVHMWYPRPTLHSHSIEGLSCRESSSGVDMTAKVRDCKGFSHFIDLKLWNFDKRVSLLAADPKNKIFKNAAYIVGAWKKSHFSQGVFGRCEDLQAARHIDFMCSFFYRRYCPLHCAYQNSRETCHTDCETGRVACF